MVSTITREQSCGPWLALIGQQQPRPRSCLLLLVSYTASIVSLSFAATVLDAVRIDRLVQEKLRHMLVKLSGELGRLLDQQ